MATAQQEKPQADDNREALARVLDVKSSLSGKAATLLGVPAAQVCKHLRNVWTVSNGKEPLTDQEMFQGISMIARYELDPIAREITVTRDGKGRLLTIIRIDGWIKILDRTDHYDGMDVEEHFGDDKKIEWIETRIFSSKRTHPTVYRAHQSDYRNVAGPVAGSMPIHMLRLFSLRHAARLFTPLGGNVVTEEEAGIMMRGDFGDQSMRDSSGSNAIPGTELESRVGIKATQPLAKSSTTAKTVPKTEKSTPKATEPETTGEESIIDEARRMFAECENRAYYSRLYDSYLGPDSTIKVSEDERTEIETIYKEARERFDGTPTDTDKSQATKNQGVVEVTELVKHVCERLHKPSSQVGRDNILRKARAGDMGDLTDAELASIEAFYNDLPAL